jgi:Domain of unknown function (DUF4177)
MKWEYKTVKIGAVSLWKGVDFKEDEVNEYMNKLGRLGWELISAFDTNEGHGNTLHIVLIFKRPLAE